ncbi:hypothetical protein QR680_016123 [Steinernema hermaphroditum]|uniref:Uncharacterized protein n=1 Tax=Steinernema hermaphroditum TaxID=289476 RepID=A0AA39LLT2_9BILA|nr:hypothetical protein QR680_016123 [Steinernema hermaphroditum]
MLWVVFIALLSVAAATYSSDKWRLESFCANGIMKNGRCYKALQGREVWLDKNEDRKRQVKYHCNYHAMDYYSPLLLSKDMESADISLYIYASVPFVNDPVIKELESAGLLESYTAYRASVIGDALTRNVTLESTLPMYQRGLICFYEYFDAAEFEDLLAKKTPQYPVAASSKEWRIEGFCKGGKIEMDGNCYKPIPVEDIAYGLPLLHHFDLKIACENALIKYYLPIFASRKLNFDDILKYFESHPADDPSNSEPMMMASSIKGYCGANKAMYYVQSLPNLKDTFYTTDEVEYNEVISSNKFYKGMDHGVAFYVW